MLHDIIRKQPTIPVEIITEIAACTLEALSEKKKAKLVRKIGKAVKKIIKNSEKIIIH